MESRRPKTTTRPKEVTSKEGGPKERGTAHKPGGPERKQSETGLVKLYSEEDETGESSGIESSGVESSGGRGAEKTNLVRRPEPLEAARAGPQDHVLVMVLHGADAGKTFRVGTTATFGRGAAEIPLDDTAVSREHARLVRDAQGRYTLEDLGSSNGTFLDGVRVTGPTRLANGARIQFGPTQVVRFFMTDAVEAQLYEQMFLASTRDPLTQSFNRRYFHDRLTAELAYSARHRTPLGLLLLDVDHFKKVNDQHGHLIGDEVLRLIARRVTNLIRTEDLFARVGGEEFAVLVRGIPHENSIQLAERVREEIAGAPLQTGGQTLAVTVSLGVATYPMERERKGDLADALYAQADARLYRAKSEGRNRTVGE